MSILKGPDKMQLRLHISTRVDHLFARRSGLLQAVDVGLHECLVAGIIHQLCIATLRSLDCGPVSSIGPAHRDALVYLCRWPAPQQLCRGSQEGCSAAANLPEDLLQGTAIICYRKDAAVRLAYDVVQAALGVAEPHGPTRGDVASEIPSTTCQRSD